MAAGIALRFLVARLCADALWPALAPARILSLTLNATLHYATLHYFTTDRTPILSNALICPHSVFGGIELAHPRLYLNSYSYLHLYFYNRYVELSQQTGGDAPSASAVTEGGVVLCYHSLKVLELVQLILTALNNFLT